MHFNATKENIKASLEDYCDIGEREVTRAITSSHQHGVVISPFLSWILPILLVMFTGCQETSLILNALIRWGPFYSRRINLPGNVMCLAFIPDGTCMWVENGRGEDVALLHLSRDGRRELEEQGKRGEDEKEGLGEHLGSHGSVSEHGR